MNGQQILRALQGKLSQHNMHFIGCLSADKVALLDFRNKDDKPIAFIANVLSAEKNHLMGHWVGYYVVGQCIYFFDSFSLNPRLYSQHFLHFLNKHKEFTIFKLAFRLQSDQSLVCGAYCIQFIYLCDHVGIVKTSEFMRKNYDTSNYVRNDRKVLSYAYEKFKMPPCRSTFCSQGLTYKMCIKLCAKHRHHRHCAHMLNISD